MRALVVGYFSTVGDLEVLWQVERRLQAEGMAYDVGAFARTVNDALPGSVDPREVDPERYTHLLVVCGPFRRDFFRRQRFDLDRFAHCVRVGVGLTMVEDPEVYNPFDVLIGRDSSRWAHPDLSFVEPVDRVPVVGLVLAPDQPEYGDRQRHGVANDALRRLVVRSGVAAVELDTRWPRSRNPCGWGSAAEVESVWARMDAVLTTRLHGMVFALKHGVPAVAVDAISGGDKVARQADVVGWPEVFLADSVTDEQLDGALSRCLGSEARKRAAACALAASEQLAGFAGEFAAALGVEPEGKPAGTPPDPVPRQTLRSLVGAALRRVGLRR